MKFILLLSLLPAVVITESILANASIDLSKSSKERFSGDQQPHSNMVSPFYFNNAYTVPEVQPKLVVKLYNYAAI